MPNTNPYKMANSNEIFTTISNWLTHSGLSLAHATHSKKLIMAPNARYPLDLIGFPVSILRNRGNKKTILKGTEPRCAIRKSEENKEAPVKITRRKSSVTFEPDAEELDSAVFTRLAHILVKSKKRKDELRSPVFSSLAKILTKSNARIVSSQKPVMVPLFKILEKTGEKQKSLKSIHFTIFKTLSQSSERLEELKQVHTKLFKTLTISGARRKADALIMKEAQTRMVNGRPVVKKLSKVIKRKKSSKEDSQIIAAGITAPDAASTITKPKSKTLPPVVNNVKFLEEQIMPEKPAMLGLPKRENSDPNAALTTSAGEFSDTSYFTDSGPVPKGVHQSTVVKQAFLGFVPPKREVNAQK